MDFVLLWLINVTEPCPNSEAESILDHFPLIMMVKV